MSSVPTFTARNSPRTRAPIVQRTDAQYVAERLRIEEGNLAHLRSVLAEYEHTPAARAFYTKHIARTEQRIAELKSTIGETE